MLIQQNSNLTKNALISSASRRAFSSQVFVTSLFVAFTGSTSAVLLWYVSTSCANMLYTDQYRIVPQIAEWSSGGDSSLLQIIWQQHAGHRCPFVYIVMILNLFLFDYNTLVESYLAAILIACTSGVLLMCLLGPASKDGGDPVLLAPAGLCISLACVSWINSGMVAWSIGFFIFAKTLSIILALIAYEKLSLAPAQRGNQRAFAAFCVPLLMLIVMAGYLAAFVPALVAVLGLSYVTQKRPSLSVLFAAMTGSATALLIYSIGLESFPGNKASLTIPSIVGFVLFLYGNALFFNSETIPRIAYLVSGAALLLVSAFVFWAHVRRKSFSIIPLGLIAYSLCFAFVSAVSRSWMGSDYGLQPRYIPEIHLGIVGSVIGLAILANEWRWIGRSLVVVYFGALCVLFSWSIVREMNTGPYRKVAFQNLAALGRQYLFQPGDLSKEDLKSFNGNNPREIRNALETCAAYGLSAFGAPLNPKGAVHLGSAFRKGTSTNAFEHFVGEGFIAFPGSDPPAMVFALVRKESEPLTIKFFRDGREVLCKNFVSPLVVNDLGPFIGARWNKVTFRLTDVSGIPMSNVPFNVGVVGRLVTEHSSTIPSQPVYTTALPPDTAIEESHSSLEAAIVGWGPQSTKAGTAFNVQPDGSSAMWLKVQNFSLDKGNYIEFGENKLTELMQKRDLVTFAVPANAYATAGDQKIRFFEAATGRWIDVGVFKVLPAQ